MNLILRQGAVFTPQQLEAVAICRCAAGVCTDEIGNPHRFTVADFPSKRLALRSSFLKNTATKNLIIALGKVSISPFLALKLILNDLYGHDSIEVGNQTTI